MCCIHIYIEEEEDICTSVYTYIKTLHKVSNNTTCTPKNNIYQSKADVCKGMEHESQFQNRTRK